MQNADNPLNVSSSAFTTQGKTVTLNCTEALSKTAFKAESHLRRGASAALTLWHRDGERDVLFKDAPRLVVPDGRGAGNSKKPPEAAGRQPAPEGAVVRVLGADGAGGGVSPRNPSWALVPPLGSPCHPVAPPPPPTAGSVVSRLCARRHRHTPTHASHWPVPQPPHHQTTSRQ